MCLKETKPPTYPGNRMYMTDQLCIPKRQILSCVNVCTICHLFWHGKLYLFNWSLCFDKVLASWKAGAQPYWLQYSVRLEYKIFWSYVLCSKSLKSVQWPVCPWGQEPLLNSLKSFKGDKKQHPFLMFTLGLHKNVLRTNDSWLFTPGGQAQIPSGYRRYVLRWAIQAVIGWN